MTSVRSRWLVLFLLTVALALAIPPGIAASSAQEETESEISRELREMYEADQASRQFTSPPTPEQWEQIVEQDTRHRERVLELLRDDRLAAAADFYHAAMILQHGDQPEHYLLAHLLSTVAGFEGDERGPWLSAASLDRYLHSIDRPQVLGTQYRRPGPDDPWGQGEYDDWLPDSIRARFGVPSRAEQRDRVDEMNARQGALGRGGARSPHDS